MTMEDMNACAECGFITNNFTQFTEHIEQHENQQQLPPPSLQAVTKPLQEWNEDSDEPQNLSMSAQPFLSDVLSLSLATPPKGSKTIHSCPHCNFTTFMSQHMKSHLEAHERHQGQMYQCDICHMQFSQKANMHRHRMRHSGVKPYQCRYCLKKFFRKDQMQEHSMTHIKTGADFDCPVAMCEQQFSQHASLRSHLDDAHAIAPSSPAPCKRCSLLFSNARRLLLHYQTKHDEGDTSGVVVAPLGAVPKSGASPPAAKRRRPSLQSTLSVTQNISAAIQQQLKLIQHNSFPLGSDYIIPPMYHTHEPSPYTFSNEELLMSLSNTTIPSIFSIEDIKAEAAMQLWTLESNNSSSSTDNTEEESNSPSVGSGSSAVDGETGGREQQECMHCGMIFMDQTLYLLHQGLHSDSDPWKCNLCGYACGDKYMFTTHVITSDHSC